MIGTTKLTILAAIVGASNQMQLSLPKERMRIQIVGIIRLKKLCQVGQTMKKKSATTSGVLILNLPNRNFKKHRLKDKSKQSLLTRMMGGVTLRQARLIKYPRVEAGANQTKLPIIKLLDGRLKSKIQMFGGTVKTYRLTLLLR